MRFAQLPVILLCVILVSCYSLPTYRPDTNVISNLSINQARESFLRSAKTSPDEYLKDIKLARSGTAMAVKLKDGSNCVTPFQDFEHFTSDIHHGTYFGVYDIRKYYPKDPNGPYFVGNVYFGVKMKFCDNEYLVGFYFKAIKDAQDFADALYVLTHTPVNQLYIPPDPPQVVFEEAARQYHAQAQKPALPEGAWKYKVQADTAINKMQYDEAIELYEQALKVAPWWPQGHFNRAMLMGNVKDYYGAVQEMKRYLVLESDAPDARKAQDQIYQWEGKAK